MASHDITHIPASAISGEQGASSKDMLDRVYEHLGGVDAVAKRLARVIKRLSNRKPMPASVGNMLISLLKLQEGIEARQRSESIFELSTSQLTEAQHTIRMRIISTAVEDPEAREELVKMLRNQGVLPKDVKTLDAPDQT
jgi:hypothetical protein